MEPNLSPAVKSAVNVLDRGDHSKKMLEKTAYGEFWWRRCGSWSTVTGSGNNPQGGGHTWRRLAVRDLGFWFLKKLGCVGFSRNL